MAGPIRRTEVMELMMWIAITIGLMLLLKKLP